MHLCNESIKAKDHIARLESHVSRLSDSQSLLDHVSKQQQVIESIQGKLDKCLVSLSAKDDIVKSLEKELDTLHRAFDVQDRYEPPHRSESIGPTGAIQAERDKMRSLYYELGKRQSDAHSLTLSLADSSIQIKKLQQNLAETITSVELIQNEKIALQTQCDDLTKRNSELLDELSQSQGKAENLKELNVKTTSQIEDLSKRLSELRTTSDAIIAEKEALVFELSSLLYNSQLEIVSLNGRTEELKQSVAILQSANELSEQRALSSLNDAIAERKLLAGKLRDAEMMKPQLVIVNERLEEAIQDGEMKVQMIQAVEQSSMKDITQARVIAEELQRELVSSQQQLEFAQQRESDLEEERAHALTTLQRTLEAAKSLTIKLQYEKDRRVAAEERATKAERLADGLQKAKEHVSSAVLDALHQEKSKSLRLEKIVQQITNSREGRDIPVKMMSLATSSSYPIPAAGLGPGPAPVPGEYDFDRRKPVSSRSSDSGLGERFDPPSSSSRQSYVQSDPSTPTRHGADKDRVRDRDRDRDRPEHVSHDIAAEASSSDIRKKNPSFSQSSPNRVTPSMAPDIPGNAAASDTSVRSSNTTSREIHLKTMSFGTPSRSVVDGLTRCVSVTDGTLFNSTLLLHTCSYTQLNADIFSYHYHNTHLMLPSTTTLCRLRDHLREIEEGAPSPLNQSKAPSRSDPKSDSFYRYTSRTQEVDSRSDSSSFEADPDGWRETLPSRSIVAPILSTDSGHGGEVDGFNRSNGRDKGRVHSFPSRGSQGEGDDLQTYTHPSTHTYTNGNNGIDSKHSQQDLAAYRNGTDRHYSTQQGTYTNTNTNTANDVPVNFHSAKSGSHSNYDTASDEEISLFDLAR